MLHVGSTTGHSSLDTKGGPKADGSFSINLKDQDVEDAKESNVIGADLDLSGLVTGDRPPSIFRPIEPGTQITGPPQIFAPRIESQPDGSVIVPAAPQSQALVTRGEMGLSTTNNERTVELLTEQRGQADAMQQMMISGMQLSRAFADRMQHSQGQIDHLHNLLVGLQNVRAHEGVSFRQRVEDMLRHQQADHERQAAEYIEAQRRGYEGLLAQQQGFVSNLVAQAGGQQLTIADQHATMSDLQRRAKLAVDEQAGRAASLQLEGEQLTENANRQIAELEASRQALLKEGTALTEAANAKDARIESLLQEGNALLSSKHQLQSEAGTAVSQRDEYIKRLEAVVREQQTALQPRQQAPPDDQPPGGAGGPAAAAGGDGGEPPRSFEGQEDAEGAQRSERDSRAERRSADNDKRQKEFRERKQKEKAERERQGGQEDEDMSAEADAAEKGNMAVTQRPVRFFDIPRLYEKYLRKPTRPMPRAVGADVRRIQDLGGFRTLPWHGRHLENVSIKV